MIYVANCENIRMDVKYQSSLRINVKAFKAGRSLYLFYAPHAVVFIQKHYPVIRKNYLLCGGPLSQLRVEQGRAGKITVWKQKFFHLIGAFDSYCYDACSGSCCHEVPAVKSQVEAKKKVYLSVNNLSFPFKPKLLLNGSTIIKTIDMNWDRDTREEERGYFAQKMTLSIPLKETITELDTCVFR